MRQKISDFPNAQKGLYKASYRLAAIALALIAVILMGERALAQTTVPWNNIECGGGGWDGPNVGPAGPATQQFSDVRCLGVNMSVGYSGNMWDNNSTPNLYGAGEAPVPPLVGALRWTNNTNDTGAGAVGSSTGPTSVTFLFDQPVFLNTFTVASLSRLANPEGAASPFRYEWMDVRVFDKDNNLLTATTVVPSTYAPDGSIVTRPDSPVIQATGTGIYNLRGTSTQGACPNECGYDRLTFGFTTTPIQRIELIHFVTDGPTVTDPRSAGLTSVAIEPLVISPAEEGGTDWGDAPNTYGTLSSSNGPRHGIFENLFLGTQEDAEENGLPTNNADGDDTTGVDDEDGVIVADLVLTEGQPVVVRVTATNQTTSPAFLYGWIDFDGDGQFQVDESANVTVNAGASQQQVQLNFGNAPVDLPATTYARFRLSTDTAGTQPTGAARDGEVEDYLVTASSNQLDWGDAPDTGAGAGVGNYNTLNSDNGPRHTIIANLSIGALIDDEADGQQSANANGDDTTNVDDEDGVTIPALVEGQTAIVTVNVTNVTGEGAQLYGWIDFNGNGVFEVAERVTAAVPTGANDVDVTLNFGIVPAEGITQTYARFRLSSDDAASSPIGPAQGGEVEDYLVTISSGPQQTFDWGDAPDTAVGTGAGNYNTLANDNGPRHVITDGLLIGLRVDAETDGQPTANVDGDDINPPTALDDEDGVNPFDLALVEGDSAVIRVTATNQSDAPAVLYGWVDFNGDGVFQVSERATVAVPAGALNSVVSLDFGTVPASGVTETVARFRLSTDTSAGEPTGPAEDGEVEDHRVTIGTVVDWGDAPDGAVGTGMGNYNTLAADNGPSHRVIEGLSIGAVVDGESDGQPTVNATGDDTNPAGAADDEDGVLISDLTLEEGQGAEVTVVVNNTTQEAAALYGWIDFNADGVFDATESAQVSVPAGTTLTPVTLDFGLVPALGVTQSYARFRLSTDTAAALPTGAVGDGEVEDYSVTITSRPAAIDLVSFTAEQAAGANIIRWVTAGEVDTNGFHLARSTTGERKDAVRINSTMIPAKGPNGGQYEYVDGAVLAGLTYSYWLIEVENNEDAAEYGPVEVVARDNEVRQHTIFLPVIVR